MSQSMATSNLIELEAAAYYLRQLRQFLKGISDAQFATQVPAVGGSVGGHTRHVIEHYEAILTARATGQLCFEERQRDPRLQAERPLALERLQNLEDELGRWSEDYGSLNPTQGQLPCLEAPLLARTSLTGDLSQTVEVPSTFSREWIYVILHAVHHLALMATAARLQGLEVDPALGRAPATLHFEGHPVDYRDKP